MKLLIFIAVLVVQGIQIPACSMPSIPKQSYTTRPTQLKDHLNFQHPTVERYETQILQNMEVSQPENDEYFGNIGKRSMAIGRMGLRPGKRDAEVVAPYDVLLAPEWSPIDMSLDEILSEDYQ